MAPTTRGSGRSPSKSPIKAATRSNQSEDNNAKEVEAETAPASNDTAADDSAEVESKGLETNGEAPDNGNTTAVVGAGDDDIVQVAAAVEKGNEKETKESADEVVPEVTAIEVSDAGDSSGANVESKESDTATSVVSPAKEQVEDVEKSVDAAIVSGENSDTKEQEDKNEPEEEKDLIVKEENTEMSTSKEVCDDENKDINFAKTEDTSANPETSSKDDEEKNEENSGTNAPDKKRKELEESKNKGAVTPSSNKKNKNQNKKQKNNPTAHQHNKNNKNHTNKHTKNNTGDPQVKEEEHVHPNSIGRIIGRGGETIRDLEARSSCRITVDHHGNNANPEEKRRITYAGTRRAVDMARTLVGLLCREPTDGGGGSRASASEMDRLPLGDAVRKTVRVPSRHLGRIIGRGGETIRDIQRRSCARVQVDHSAPEVGNERAVVVTGTEGNVARAVEMVEFCAANPEMDGGQALGTLARMKSEGRNPAQEREQAGRGGGNAGRGGRGQQRRGSNDRFGRGGGNGPSGHNNHYRDQAQGNLGPMGAYGRQDSRGASVPPPPAQGTGGDYSWQGGNDGRPFPPPPQFGAGRDRFDGSSQGASGGRSGNNYAPPPAEPRYGAPPQGNGPPGRPMHDGRFPGGPGGQFPPPPAGPPRGFADDAPGTVGAGYGAPPVDDGRRGSAFGAGPPPPPGPPGRAPPGAAYGQTPTDRFGGSNQISQPVMQPDHRGGQEFGQYGNSYGPPQNNQGPPFDGGAGGNVSNSHAPGGGYAQNTQQQGRYGDNYSNNVQGRGTFDGTQGQNQDNYANRNSAPVPHQPGFGGGGPPPNHAPPQNKYGQPNGYDQPPYAGGGGQANVPYSQPNMYNDQRGYAGAQQQGMSGDFNRSQPPPPSSGLATGPPPRLMQHQQPPPSYTPAAGRGYDTSGGAGPAGGNTGFSPAQPQMPGAYPQAAMVGVGSPPPQRPPPIAPAPQPLWKTATASDGQTYYYNTKSGETQWNKPVGM
mmetsp:Transcript_1944/g.4175  ORF Transcript_1944/g.4175 Transcript_1944/m.4175 type:complete len:990 (+) Transcript_1944:111-3080(+)|eukprot:CAMPEP_0194327996 /NCGR_PEP_ID=MMETSP0171-20130528/43257_1 /TAXON_ID=218684 /ORGANISM="Corethron pennatum, Strain L29A3" /LENGTH=989 /DNA_ID=CAMNT_0039088161 /DNA_START=74 /DNA_END=3043 /DNA_ORIENTATION=-